MFSSHRELQSGYHFGRCRLENISIITESSVGEFWYSEIRRASTLAMVVEMEKQEKVICIRCSIGAQQCTASFTFLILGHHEAYSAIHTVTHMSTDENTKCQQSFMLRDDNQIVTQMKQKSRSF